MNKSRESAIIAIVQKTNFSRFVCSQVQRLLKQLSARAWNTGTVKSFL